MKCEELKESLWLYQSGEMDSVNRQEVEGHMQSCPACSKELSLLNTLIASLPKTVPLSDRYWESYTQKVMDRIEKKEPGKSHLFLWRWVPVTALVLVLFGGITFYRMEEQKKTDEMIEDVELLEHLEVLERDDLFNEKI